MVKIFNAVLSAFDFHDYCTAVPNSFLKNHNYDDYDDDTRQVCPIQDDEDGHLSYKLGDIIENETQRCKLQYSWSQRCLVAGKMTRNTRKEGNVLPSSSAK